MAASSPPTIALFCKYPSAGKAKTRLIPALGPEGAARVHRRLAERTLATVRSSGLPFAIYTSGAPIADFAVWLGHDITFIDQGEGDLGDRLGRVPAPAILLGADVPDLTPLYLQQAARALQGGKLVVGPAKDGGYYLLGLAEPMPFLFTNMDWGTDNVLPETLSRIAANGMSAPLLKPLDDCDRPEDLHLWPELTAP